ncbi:unnamed protein product [Heterobilharzia americana]|nr:unnamed protein product [Heterobilharzia americana]
MTSLLVPQYTVAFNCILCNGIRDHDSNADKDENAFLIVIIFGDSVGGDDGLLKNKIIKIFSMHCITSVLSNSSKQTAESHLMAKKSLSPSSPTQAIEKQFTSSLFTASMAFSSIPSSVGQSAGQGMNSTKTFTANLNANSMHSSERLSCESVKSKELSDINDSSSFMNSQNLLSNLPSICFGMSNDSILSQIANGHATSLLSMPTPPFPSDICINKFPDNLVRNWTEGYTNINSPQTNPFSTNTMITNVTNPGINTVQDNNLLPSVGVNNTLNLRSHCSDLSLSINDLQNTISNSSNNLAVSALTSSNINSNHNLEKSNTIVSNNKTLPNNSFTVLNSTAYQNSCVDSNKSRASNNNNSSNIPQNNTMRKTDEDFCDLCQKHFCNKYYLRKHKIDVHGIHTEPYSHSRRRASETQTGGNSNHAKCINLSLGNNSTSSTTITTSPIITPSLTGNNNKSVALNGDNSKMTDKSKRIDFSMDYDKCQLSDFMHDAIRTQSSTKFELNNKSLPSIYDYISSGSNSLFPSQKIDIINEKLGRTEEMNHRHKSCVTTTNVNTLCSTNNNDNDGNRNHINHSTDLSQSIIGGANIPNVSPTFDIYNSNTTKHNISSGVTPDSNQQCVINSSILQSKNLNPLLSAHHYYMTALAANFSSSTANMLNSPDVMKSNLMNKSNSNLDISFLAMPPSFDLNNITLREAKCDHCQKVFCNEYFLQLHLLSHQNNLDESSWRNEQKQLEIPEEYTGEMEDISNTNRNSFTQHDNEKSDIDMSINNNIERNSQRYDRDGAEEDENDHALTFSEIDMNYPRSSEFQPGSHSLDAFKNSMVAAKLADRVTCELCNKELCNKYFLRTHKIRVHGVSPKDVGGPPMRNPPAMENSSNSYPETTNSVAVSHDLNCTATVDENCKMDTSFCDDMMNPFNSAYSTFGLVNQFLPFAYWPLFTPNQFIPEQMVNCQLDKSLISDLDSVAMWNSLNSSIANDIYNQTGIASGSSNTQNTGITEIPSAITLIYCPLCDLPIGPRLFLPTHLSSVHKLCPTDPDFFMNMLRAKPMSKADHMTDTKACDYWSTIFSTPLNKQIGDNSLEVRSKSDTFQHDEIDVRQPNANHVMSERSSPSGKIEDTASLITYNDNLIIKELQPFIQKTELGPTITESISSSVRTSANESQARTAMSNDSKTEIQTTGSHLTSTFLTSNQVISATNSIPFFPINLAKIPETTTITENIALELPQEPLYTSTCGNNDSTLQPTVAAFSGIPINPIAAMAAAAAPSNSNSGRSWDSMLQISTTGDASNFSIHNQLRKLPIWTWKVNFQYEIWLEYITPESNNHSARDFPQLEDKETHISQKTTVSSDNQAGSPPSTYTSECNEIPGKISSFPLLFQPTINQNLPWLGYGLPHQPSSLNSYSAITYPNIIPFPILSNSDIHSYSQTDMAEKLKTTLLLSCDTSIDWENEENKNPLNLSLKVSGDNLNEKDQKGTCCATITTTTTTATNNAPCSTTTTTPNLRETMINKQEKWTEQGQYHRALKLLHCKSNHWLLLQMKKKRIYDVNRKEFTNHKKKLDNQCEQTVHP